MSCRSYFCHIFCRLPAEQARNNNGASTQQYWQYQRNSIKEPNTLQSTMSSIGNSNSKSGKFHSMGTGNMIKRIRKGKIMRNENEQKNSNEGKFVTTNQYNSFVATPQNHQQSNFQQTNIIRYSSSTSAVENNKPRNRNSIRSHSSDQNFELTNDFSVPDTSSRSLYANSYDQEPKQTSHQYSTQISERWYDMGETEKLKNFDPPCEDDNVEINHVKESSRSSKAYRIPDNKKSQGVTIHVFGDSTDLQMKKKESKGDSGLALSAIDLFKKLTSTMVRPSRYTPPPPTAYPSSTSPTLSATSTRTTWKSPTQATRINSGGSQSNYGVEIIPAPKSDMTHPISGNNQRTYSSRGSTFSNNNYKIVDVNNNHRASSVNSISSGGSSSSYINPNNHKILDVTDYDGYNVKGSTCNGSFCQVFLGNEQY